jgi:DNA-binding NtrC family response regulator
LRERKDDIPVLAFHFLKKYSKKNSKNVQNISPDVIRILESYNWEGNVRELENVIERGVVVSKGKTLTSQCLPPYLLPNDDSLTFKEGEKLVNLGSLSFKQAKNMALNTFASRYFSEILQEFNGNLSKAAERANLDRSNLKKILKKYSINPADYKS